MPRLTISLPRTTNAKAEAGYSETPEGHHRPVKSTASQSTSAKNSSQCMGLPSEEQKPPMASNKSQECISLSEDSESEGSESEGSEPQRDAHGLDSEYTIEIKTSRIPANSKKEQNKSLSTRMGSKEGQKPRPRGKPKANKEAPKTTKLPTLIEPARDMILRLRAERDKRDVRLKDKAREIKALKKEIADRDADIDDLKTGLRRAADKNDELEKTFRKIHDDQLDLLGKDELDAEPDDEVQRKLNTLFRDSKSWAENWCIASWNFEDLSEFRETVYYDHRSREGGLVSQRLFKAIEARKVSPKVVLNALLNMSICDATFERPYSHLRKFWNADDSTAVEESLNFIASLAKMGSPEAGSLLRAYILHAVEMPPKRTQEQVEQIPRFGTIQQMRDTHCRSRELSFLSSYANLLHEDIDDSEESSRTEELLALFTTAIDISASLSVQKPEIIVKFDLNQRFQINSPKFMPHRGMKLKEDETDEDGRDPIGIGIIGKPLDLVVEPTILKAGDKDGKNYGQLKLMHSGIVWVVSDDQLTGLEKPMELPPVCCSSPLGDAPITEEQTPLVVTKRPEKNELASTECTESSSSGRTISPTAGSNGTQRKKRNRMAHSAKRERKEELLQEMTGKGGDSAVSSMSRTPRESRKTSASGSPRHMTEARPLRQANGQPMTSNAQGQAPTSTIPSAIPNSDKYQGFFGVFTNSDEFKSTDVPKTTSEMKWKDLGDNAIAAGERGAGLKLPSDSQPRGQQQTQTVSSVEIPSKRTEPEAKASGRDVNGSRNEVESPNKKIKLERHT